MQTDANPAQASKSAFNLRRAFFRHLRESVAHYGVFRTLRELVATVYRVLRDRMPGRRRGRYGDLDFDWAHMVDTTRSNLGFRAQLTSALTGLEYFPTEPWLFEQIMQALSVHLQDFLFLDLGSGKGRALLMASSYPFRRILGVECLPGLHCIAQENIAHYSSEKQLCRQIELLCQDARDFEFPPEPTVLYLFNPFPEPVFARMLERLKQSLEDNPRPFYVAYRYPEHERLLIGCEWLEKIAGTEQWVVYSYILC